MSGHASDILNDYLTLIRRSVAVPAVAVSPLTDRLPARDGRPCVVMLSPHPDDECLTGALPLRLKNEQDWQIINIAVTLGSDSQRRAARAREAEAACQVLGFDGVLPTADGFSDLRDDVRLHDPAGWHIKTERLALHLNVLRPQAVFMPHAGDAHPAHRGTHFLAMDALARMPTEFTCAVIQTEYWHANAAANLMVGIGVDDAATLLTALACHVGENARNPYDARFPAYLIDNVRRGAEIIGGKGMDAPAMDFAMLYEFGIWKNAALVPSALNRIVGVTETLDSLISVFPL